MDKFRVGQMVRVVICYRDPRLNDAIATVTMPMRLHYPGTSVNTVMKKPWYGYSLDITHQADFDFYPTESQLAPIYDGDQASSWEECAWRPKVETIDLR